LIYPATNIFVQTTAQAEERSAQNMFFQTFQSNYQFIFNHCRQIKK